MHIGDLETQLRTPVESRFRVRGDIQDLFVRYQEPELHEQFAEKVHKVHVF